MRRAPLPHTSATPCAEALPGPSDDAAVFPPAAVAMAGPDFAEELAAYRASTAAVEQFARDLARIMTPLEIATAVVGVALVVRGFWPAITAALFGAPA